MGKWCLQASMSIFYQIFVKLADNQHRHKTSNEFEFRPDRISLFGVTHPWGQIIFSIDLLWKRQDQLAYLDRILYAASVGWGKGCFKVLEQIPQNCGCHGTRKCPLTYNGKNHVSTLSPLFLIWSSDLQVTRTVIQSQMSSNFSHIRSLT